MMSTPGAAGISALALLFIGVLTAGAGEPLAARPEEKKSHFGAALALCPARSADAPKELVVKRGDRIVAIGDSITRYGGTASGWLRQAYFALAQTHPELIWAKDVQRVEKFEKGEPKPGEAAGAPAPPASEEKLSYVICAGIGSQTSTHIAARFAKDVVENRPAVAIINCGINDVYHGLGAAMKPEVAAAYRANVAKMVDQAQAAGIRHVILLAPTVIGENPDSEGNRRLALLVEAMKQVAAEKKCPFINLHEIYLKAYEKRPAGLAKDRGWLTGEGVHLTGLGDLVIAAELLRALGLSDEEIRAYDKARPIPGYNAPAYRGKPAGS